MTVAFFLLLLILFISDRLDFYTALSFTDVVSLEEEKRYPLDETSRASSYGVLAHYRDELRVENVELALLRVCSVLQAYLVACHNCYAVYGNVCDGFELCREVKAGGVNPDDEEVVWGFMLSVSGSVSSLFSGGSTLTDLTSLPSFGRNMLIGGVLSPSDVVLADGRTAGDMIYERPQRNFLGCGYEQVVRF